MFFPSASPFLVLKVQRDNLIRSALTQLSGMDPGSLKKPLKVIFDGEEGIDEGGVAKEFFQLLIRDMFDVKYGMFMYDEDTRNFWFRPADEWSDPTNFKLVGLVRTCAAAAAHDSLPAPGVRNHNGTHALPLPRLGCSRAAVLAAGGWSGYLQRRHPGCALPSCPVPQDARHPHDTG